jgi:hypothetical protein
MKNNINCECCGKKVKNAFATIKYCNSCIVHNTQYRKKLSYLNSRINLLENKYYKLLNKKENTEIEDTEMEEKEGEKKY